MNISKQNQTKQGPKRGNQSGASTNFKQLMYNSENAASGLHPIVIWTGGKKNELKYIYPSLPSYNRYIEPFVGGGSVFMGINANEHFINDISSDLISIYRNIKNQDNCFFEYIEKIDLSWKKAGDFSTRHQDNISGIYFQFQEKNAPEHEIKMTIENYCDAHHSEICDIVSDFIDLTPILTKEIKKTLYRKFKKMKDCNWTNDINSTIKTAIKGALYIAFRSLYNDKKVKEMNQPLHSALTLFIRQTVMSGMFRVNKEGKFNAPYGGLSRNNMSLSTKLERYQSNPVKNHFNNTHIYNVDFEDFLISVNPTENDFIFLDPPYDCVFSSYDGNDFTKREHIRLARYLQEKCRAKWMMIIGKTDFIESLYCKGNVYVQEYEKVYNGNIKNNKNRCATHLLITNYPQSIENRMQLAA